MTAEQAVLGSMLTDPGAAQEALDQLSAEQFAAPAEERIFRAALRCRAQHKAVDLVTLTAMLTESGDLDFVGGVGYLVELGQMVPTAANISSYIKQVRDDHSRRELVHGLQQLLGEAPRKSPQELSAEISMLSRMHEGKEQAQGDSMREIAMEELQAMERRAAHQDTPLKTGIVKLDAVTGGMSKGEMWIIGARPSVGKSTLAFQIAQNVVLAGKTAVFFSAEMSRAMVAQRLFAQAGLPTYKSRTGDDMTQEDWDNAMQGLLLAQKLERLYVDTTSSSISDIRSRCRQTQAREGLDLVVVDYLQILQADGRRESRNLEVASISADMKRLAKDLGIPVVVLSQLSRAGAYNDKPTLMHLRDSGSIEQDADVAVLMYRLEGEAFTEEYGPIESWLLESGNTIVRMDVAKNRNGPLGYADMMLNGNHAQFCVPFSPLPPEQQSLI